MEDRYDEALTDDALALVGRLHEELDGRRRELLDARQELQVAPRRGRDARLRDGARGLHGRPGARRAAGPARRDHRADEPQDGHQRAQLGRARLHGGLRGLELALLEQHGRGPGEPRRRDPRSSIEHDENGKDYSLGDDPAVLHVRPRGLHLPEAHLQIDGQPVAGAFMDFGLYVHRNAEALLERGWGRTSTSRSWSRSTRRRSGATRS